MEIGTRAWAKMAECVFGPKCKMKGVTGYEARVRYYPCAKHFYHSQCTLGVKAIYGTCACAVCDLPIGINDGRRIETCGCSLHAGCVPWKATTKACPRCHEPITAIVDPKAVAAPPPASSRSLTWNPFGQSMSEKIHDIGSRLRIQGILDNKITFRQFEATRARLDLLESWGATPVDLKAMNFERQDLLNPRYFQPEVLAKIGYTWAALFTMYKVTWKDVKHLGLTYEQLKLLKADLFSLCENGFGYDELLGMATVRVEDWAREPFCLASNRFLLKPSAKYGSSTSASTSAASCSIFP